MRNKTMKRDSIYLTAGEGQQFHGRRVGAVWRARRLERRLARVLQLHRLRRHRDDRRGGAVWCFAMKILFLESA